MTEFILNNKRVVVKPIDLKPYILFWWLMKKQIPQQYRCRNTNRICK